MGCYNKLTAVKSCAVHQETLQFDLFFRAQTVFRLVEKIERILLDFIIKIQKCAFSIAVLSHIFHEISPDIFRPDNR